LKRRAHARSARGEVETSRLRSAAEQGWIAADRNTLATPTPGIWAIGDVTTIPLKLGKPLPKAGVFAHHQAEIVARNLAHAIEGKGTPASFDGHGECFIETSRIWERKLLRGTVPGHRSPSTLGGATSGEGALRTAVAAQMVLRSTWWRAV